MAKLRKLRLTEGSLVDRGANQFSDVLLFKRDETPADDDAAIATACDRYAENGDSPELKASFAQTIKAAVQRGFGKQTAKTTKADAPPDPLSIHQIPAGDGGDDRGPLSPSGPLDSKAPAAGDGATEDESVPDSTLEAQLADLKARLEAVEAQKVAAETKATEAQATVEEATKSLEIAKADAAEIAKVRNEVAELRKSQAQAVEKAEMLALEKRASEEFPMAGHPSVIAKQLRRIEKMEDEAERKDALGILKALNALSSGQTMAVGSSASGSRAGSAVAEFNERLAKIKADNPALDHRAASLRVMGDHEFAKRYEGEVLTHG